ncbi:MAG: transglutaminase-like cysteine peptidase [Rhizobiaceae bacterium]
MAALGRLLKAVLAAAAGLALSGTTAANSAGPMVTGGYTSQPIGHYEFCKSNPRECRIHPRDRGPAHLTQKLWRQIVRTNVAVNRSVSPMNDFDIYGKDEVWAYPQGAGDCEDYVLEKRRRLSAAGLSLSNLLITVVRKPDGEGHAILTVRTDKGDFVLDNLTDRVKPWDDTDYWFLKRQAVNHTGRWVTIDGFNNPFVGSVD